MLMQLTFFLQMYCIYLKSGAGAKSRSRVEKTAPTSSGNPGIMCLK